MNALEAEYGGGFRDEVFTGAFDFVQVTPLTRSMQREICALRLRGEAPALQRAVGRQLATRAEFAEMAANPRIQGRH